mmetsp:Transcript_8187/g.11804  ORF Transcript_8187/g.11804 Transcript_8187/m.11804 type:complete len:209 (+) Transcript_8187:145-771(+)
MSTICFGGVCIPYSAILPLIALAFKWVVTKIATLGLLPDSVVQRLGVVVANAKAKEIDDSTCRTSDSSCCPSISTGRSKTTRSKTSKAGTTAATKEYPATVQIIESVEEWDNLVQEKSEDLVVAKFTADWCKPCKAISPVYHKLASKYNATFVEVDVDEMDEVAASMNVAMMPTFVILKGKQELATVRGANERNLESAIEEHLLPRQA